MASSTVDEGQAAVAPSRIEQRSTWHFAAIGLVVFTLIVSIGYFSELSNGPSAATAGSGGIDSLTNRSDYVGATTCGQCHPKELKAWTGSHHQLAMQEANASTVLGDFKNSKFIYQTVESTFSKRDDKFIVRTDGLDGQMADYVVKYVFGVFPLQQYLVEFAGGRYQALSIAWDTRPEGEGGRRWFHLYPNEKIDHSDALHWTGRYQNWNLQCSACHSTNLQKNYFPETDSYKTTWSEINVACEACHGPGSRHVTWAKTAKPPYSSDDSKALESRLKSRWDEAWRFPSADAKYAVRDKVAPDETMNICWACHARRSVVKEGGPVSASLLDAYRPALLTPPLYHADGQQRDEVYTWGSFTQSKMFERGVTCMDCHEPHTLKLRADGNTLCGRCHNATVFDAKQHHNHEPGTKGAMCVGCHMPAQNYMVIHARPDHSFQLPRPDLSSTFGSPNGCTTCHTDRKPEWAAQALDAWYGSEWRSRPHHGTTIHAGVTQGAKGVPGLLALAQDLARPGIVRATAATLAQGNPNLEVALSADSLKGDTDPNVRIAAIGLADGLDQGARVRLLAPLLSDPIYGVRIEAGRALADVPSNALQLNDVSARDHALKEYEASLQLDADWPAANLNLGNLRLRQRQFDEARTAYERALALDPRIAGAYVYLADVYRQGGQEAEGEKTLRRGLQVLPKNAELRHAIGLLLVRRGQTIVGVGELAEAAALAPDNSRFAYVYAIGLSSTGQVARALAALQEADRRNPYNPDILSALVSLNRDAGDKPAALVAARKLADALPGDPAVSGLVSKLEGD